MLQRGKRSPLRVMGEFITSTAVTVSQVCTYVKTYQTVYLKCVLLTAHQLILHKT